MSDQKWNAPNNTALIIVDVQNGFCPGGNLAVPEGDEIIPQVNELAEKFGIVIITQDFHPEGHASFASTHEREPMEQVWMKDGQIVGEIEEGKTKAEDAPVQGAIVQTLWPDHCIQGTPDADFHPDLLSNLGEKIDGVTVLQKGTNKNIDSYSGFQENDKVSRPRFPNGETLTDTLEQLDVDRVVFVGLAYDFCVGWHALDAKNEGFEAVVVKDATRGINVPVAEGVTTGTLMDKQLADAGVVVVNDMEELGNFLQSANKLESFDPGARKRFPEKDMN